MDVVYVSTHIFNILLIFTVITEYFITLAITVSVFEQRDRIKLLLAHHTLYQIAKRFVVINIISKMTSSSSSLSAYLRFGQIQPKYYIDYLL